MGERLEGLNERYRSLSRRIEELHDEAAHYDIELDRERLRTLAAARSNGSGEAAAGVLNELAEHTPDR